MSASVIVTAIEEARRIFERMNSYAIYRIAETIRLLLFMTASVDGGLDPRLFGGGSILD